jgi:hypothetical protein
VAHPSLHHRINKQGTERDTREVGISVFATRRSGLSLQIRFDQFGPIDQLNFQVLHPGTRFKYIVDGYRALMEHL